MNHTRLSKKLVLTTGLVVAMGAFAASQSFAGQARSRTSVSDSSQSRSNSGRSAVSRGGSNNSSRSRGAAVTRSGGGERRGGSRGHGGRHGYRGRSHYSFGLGYYWPYGAFYGGYGGYYYSPFYYGYPHYYPYHPRRYSDFGALDLNVRPKKTEVWIDGQYVGTAGKFDGYPGHLWLGDGRHELILYKQGFETMRREVRVLEGVVLDIDHDMIPGAAVAPEELTAFGQEELRELDEARNYRRQVEESPRGEPSLDRRDARQEPGKLRLQIAPADASIYLDGRFLGTGHELTRLHSGLMVSPGEHTIDVVHPDFDSEEIPFFVESGEETALEIALGSA